MNPACITMQWIYIHFLSILFSLQQEDYNQVKINNSKALYAQIMKSSRKNEDLLETIQDLRGSAAPGW